MAGTRKPACAGVHRDSTAQMGALRRKRSNPGTTTHEDRTTDDLDALPISRGDSDVAVLRGKRARRTKPEECNESRRCERNRP